VAWSDYSRELRMEWSTLCENVMDPAHLPFTHHKTISSRANAAPVDFGAPQGFSASGFTAERRTAGGPGQLTFRAPLLVLAETHRGPASFSDWNVVYAVPTAPGRCRLLVRVVFEVSRMPVPLKWILGFAFTRQPTWLTHLTTHKILEDDNYFLHTQGHAYRAGSQSKVAPNWQRRLHMPITSDAMVVAFHRWVDEFTGGEGVCWSPLLAETGAAASSRASREEVLERLHSHVEHCHACSGALANMRRGRHLADAAAVVALAFAGMRRAHPGALVVAALSFAVARACAQLETLMKVGRYPPPRNE